MSKRFMHRQDARWFAPVAPVSVLRHLQANDALPIYNLILSHNVVEMKEEFQKLVKQQMFGGTWILDNSVIELGRPVDAKMIAEAHQIIWSANSSTSKEVVCVLPDELLDWKGTVSVAAKALIEFRRLKLTNLMYVPQGNTMDEIIRSAEAMQSVEEIRWIGVARNFIDILGSRKTVTRVLQSIFPKCKFHMLGFSRNTIDDLESTFLPGVEGIDSSMPLRVKGPISILSHFPKRGDWWKEDMQCTEIMINNVNQVQRWLGN